MTKLTRNTKGVRRKAWLACLLLSAAVLFTACGGGGGNNQAGENNDGNSASGTPSQEEQPVQVISGGYVMQTDDNRLLITELVEDGDRSFIEALSLAITEDTEIASASGEVLALDDLAVGSFVAAWTIGPIAESYPGQATAAKITLLDDHTVEETTVTRADAVRIALEAQTELAGPWAVKDATLAERQWWNVVLIHHQHMDQPVDVRIHAESGEIVPNVVTENEAFRIFTPHPEEVVGTNIQVEGEARVFEGAFSWFLEDGHAILAEGHVTAEQAAPEWGRFAFEVSFEKASQQNLLLVFYVESAKDGSNEHQLIIPLRIPQDLVEYPPQ